MRDFSTKLEALRAASAAGPFRPMPIEVLKSDAEAWFQGAEITRTFRSSGTTSESRSRSHFSSEGLSLYRAGSMFAFFDVLTRMFPGCAPREVAGVSLVPNTMEWPDSSLAQMIAWIGEEAPVAYASEESLEASLATSVTKGQPIWLFGTAFHLLNAIDSGAARALPLGSVVIETGGTKGKSREVTRAQLFAEIAAAFGISERRIVSEYGMCEMASQAYDWVEESSSRLDIPRRFRFPEWVRASVMTGPGENASLGEGVLTTHDPLRIDYPTGLRTEDMARVELDGSFVLIGRVPSSPLKGCSLRAEKVVATAASEQSFGKHSHPAQTMRFDLQAARVRARGINGIWKSLLCSDSLARALTLEMGSMSAAMQAVADLARSAPKDLEAWVAAAHAAVGDGEVARRWLVILPQNHSLVGFHPLLLGVVAGLTMTARVPERFATTDNAVALLLAALGISPLPPTWRLGADPHADDLFDSVLAYASDATLGVLRAATKHPVRGFGDRMGLTWLHAPDATDSDLARAAADALGLAQTGCMSTRLFVVSGIESDVAAQSFAARLARAGAAFWGESLPSRARAALDVERWRYERCGFAIITGDVATPLVTTRAWRSGDDVAQLVATRPFTLPIVTTSDKIAGQFVKATLQEILASDLFGTLTHAPVHGNMLTKSRYGILSFRAVGDANAPEWNGVHERRNLFV